MLRNASVSVIFVCSIFSIWSLQSVLASFCVVASFCVYSVWTRLSACVTPVGSPWGPMSACSFLMVVIISLGRLLVCGGGSIYHVVYNVLLCLVYILCAGSVSRMGTIFMLHSMSYVSVFTILAVIVCLSWVDTCQGFDNVAVYAAFSHVFPFKDGSVLLAGSDTSVFEMQALDQLGYIGVTDNVTVFCAKPEEEILVVLMKAALGNLIVNTSGDEKNRPFVVDPVTGKLEPVESLQNNRVLVFEVLVFALLLALARSWYAMYSRSRFEPLGTRKSL